MDDGRDDDRRLRREFERSSGLWGEWHDFEIDLISAGVLGLAVTGEKRRSGGGKRLRWWKWGAEYGFMEGFAGVVSAKVWDEFAALGKAAAYEPGQVLMRQGGTDQKIMLLLAGRVKVVLDDHEGNMIVLAIRGAGEVLGEIARLDGSGRSASVIAIDRCEVKIVDSCQFDELLERHGLTDLLVRLSIRRLRESERLRLELASLPGPERVRRALLRLAVPQGREWRPTDIGLDQREFGQSVGLSRGAVSKYLARFRAAGAISTRRGRIIVNDRELLETVP